LKIDKKIKEQEREKVVCANNSGPPEEQVVTFPDSAGFPDPEKKSHLCSTIFGRFDQKWSSESLPIIYLLLFIY